MRCSGWWLAPVLGAVVMVAAAPARADDEAWREFKGQVVVSDVLLAPSFGSDQLMIAVLRRVKCTQVASAHGFWRLHMVAFLDRAAGGSDTARVVARDVTAAAPAARHAKPRGALVKTIKV